VEEEGIHLVEHFENQYLRSTNDIDQEIEEWEEQYAESQEIIQEWEELEEIGEVYDKDELRSDYYFAIGRLESYRELLPEEKENIFAYIKYKLEQDINIKFNDLVPTLNRYIFFVWTI
jgi:hypothetical protein